MRFLVLFSCAFVFIPTSHAGLGSWLRSCGQAIVMPTGVTYQVSLHRDPGTDPQRGYSVNVSEQRVEDTVHEGKACYQVTMTAHWGTPMASSHISYFTKDGTWIETPNGRMKYQRGPERKIVGENVRSLKTPDEIVHHNLTKVTSEDGDYRMETYFNRSNDWVYTITYPKDDPTNWVHISYDSKIPPTI